MCASASNELHASRQRATGDRLGRLLPLRSPPLSCAGCGAATATYTRSCALGPSFHSQIIIMPSRVRIKTALRKSLSQGLLALSPRSFSARFSTRSIVLHTLESSAGAHRGAVLCVVVEQLLRFRPWLDASAGQPIRCGRQRARGSAALPISSRVAQVRGAAARWRQTQCRQLPLCALVRWLTDACTVCLVVVPVRSGHADQPSTPSHHSTAQRSNRVQLHRAVSPCAP